MARHINTDHKRFLADLQALMRTSYNNRPVVSNEETEAKIIEPQKPEPIQSERFRSRRHNRIISNNTQVMDDFEREYQEFIAKLKAKKEQKEEITTEPITEEPKPVEVTEPEVIEVAEPVIVEKVPVKKKRQRKKKLKEEQIENMEN